VSSPSPLQLALSKLGPLGTIDLVRRKYLKRARYKQMLRDVPRSQAVAVLRAKAQSKRVPPYERSIIDLADAMLRDENKFFTFDYQTKGVERPWDYDPIEKKYWPPRHYTEQHLHARDTPRDAKIVWEINRFKDLPTLGQAAIITKEKKYAEEVERRLLSWIEENPFAESINWASALEVSIRLLSWTSTLLLLKEAGFAVHQHAAIQRSVYEQARYLAGDLSTDKVVPSNHLIGEAAGLFIVATLWDFPAAPIYAGIAKGILEKEIIRQTYSDGVTRESSGWYHQFVTHFFVLVDRVATSSGRPMSQAFQTRLSNLKTYLGAITVSGDIVHFGDADDGWALWFEGDMEAWKTFLFGEGQSSAEENPEYFSIAQHVAAQLGQSFLFLRGGDFGMGGAGFSSHSHDDLLAPVLYLDGVPILVDPGTFVYNGDPKNRAKYRDIGAHNNVIVGEGSAARQKMNFGWREVRPSARIPVFRKPSGSVIVAGQCEDWPRITRQIELHGMNATLSDVIEDDLQESCEWLWHLSPEWSMQSSSPTEFHFVNADAARLIITTNAAFDTAHVEQYDYSPSYRVEIPATMLRLVGSGKAGSYEVSFALEH
jgi:hypothetical protein